MGENSSTDSPVKMKLILTFSVIFLWGVSSSSSLYLSRGADEKCQVTFENCSAGNPCNLDPMSATSCEVITTTMEPNANWHISWVCNESTYTSSKSGSKTVNGKTVSWNQFIYGGFGC